jgi:hypothetical protein
MRFEFRSERFRFLRGKVTFLRASVEATPALDWSAEDVDLIDDLVHAVSYDGRPGRLWLVCSTTEVQHKDTGRGFRIEHSTIVHDVTPEAVQINHSVVTVDAHAVIRVRVVDAGGHPRSGAEVRMLTASPESVSVQSATDDMGECCFLASVGFCSVYVDRRSERPREIEIRADDPVERVVRVVYPD